MFGIELLTVPAVMATQIAFSQCDHKPLPKITTKIVSKETKYDNTKSHKQLEKFKIDTVSPYEAGVHSKVSGLMSSNINVSMRANIAWSTHPITKNTCMWYDEITVDIVSAPTIFIASEHNNNRCRYNATMRHELKHIEVDESIIRKYSTQFESSVRQAARKIDVSGPFPKDQIENQRVALNAEIQRAIETTLTSMKNERRAKQQKVDSRHEYDRLSRMCDGM